MSSDLFQNSYIVGGLLSGLLHALTGPDHIVALLPIISNKRWWISSSYGAIWGAGHGFSSAMLGIIGFTLVQSQSIIRLDSILNEYKYLIDSVVGLTLIIVGAMGIYESSQQEVTEKSVEDNGKNENQDVASTIFESTLTTSSSDPLSPYLFLPDDRDDELEFSVFDFDVDTSSISSVKTLRKTSSEELHNQVIQSNSVEFKRVKQQFSIVVVLVNGVMLGLSWDGIPSLSPAAVVNGWYSLFLFLSAYCIGTMVAMMTSCGIIGECSCLLQRLVSVNISGKLAMVCSVVSCVLGLGWVVLSILHGYIPPSNEAGLSLSRDDGSFQSGSHSGSHSFSFRNGQHYIPSQTVLSMGSLSIVICAVIWTLYGEFHVCSLGGVIPQCLRQCRKRNPFSSCMPAMTQKRAVHMV